MAIGAAIAAGVGLAGSAYSANSAKRGINVPKGISPLRFASRQRLHLLSLYFPEEVGKYEISFKEFKKLKASNPSSVIRLGQWPDKDDDDARGGLSKFSASVGDFGGAAIAKSRGKGRSTGTPGGPRFFRVPTSEDFSQLQNKAFSQSIKESEVNAARLSTSELYKPLFDQSQGRLGSFGRQLDRTIEDLSGRALGSAATRGTLGNPAVANRALAPIALSRESARHSIIDNAQARIRALSTTDGLQGYQGAASSNLAGLHQLNLSGFAAGIGPQAQAQMFRSSLLNDAGAGLGSAIGRLFTPNYAQDAYNNSPPPGSTTTSGKVYV